MPGRRSTPTALKLVRGNPGKRALNEREPKPRKAKKAPPPVWLSEEGRAAWSELQPMLARMGVYTEADRWALELLVDAYAEWREVRLMVDSEGRTYESGSLQGGRMVRSHPSVQQLADAWRRVRLAMVEFGLTPSSRSKVAMGEQEEHDPLEEFLGGGKGTRRGK